MSYMSAQYLRCIIIKNWGDPLGHWGDAPWPLGGIDAPALTINLHAKFEVCTFSHSRDIRGSQNLKVGHVTQATLPCDLILYF